MKNGPALGIILVTAPDIKVARRLAHAALRARLAACANLLPAVESHYWWRGKLEKSSEVLLLIKTTKAKLKPLEKLVLKLHPYDTPEFVVIETTHVTQRYLRWACDSVQARFS